MFKQNNILVCLNIYIKKKLLQIILDSLNTNMYTITD